MSNFYVYTPPFSNVGKNWGEHANLVYYLREACVAEAGDYTRTTYKYACEHLPELREFIPGVENFDEDGILGWEHAASDEEANEKFAHHLCLVSICVAGAYRAAYEQPARDWWLRHNRELLRKMQPTFVMEILFDECRSIEIDGALAMTPRPNNFP